MKRSLGRGIGVVGYLQPGTVVRLVMLIIDGDIIVHRAGALDFHQAAFGIISIGDGLGCNDGADHQQPRSHSRQYPTSSHAHAPVAEIKRIERSEEHTSELQSLMRISYAVFCLK